MAIAPWLDTKPTDFLEATKAGTAAYLQKRGQNIGAGEANAELGERAAEAAQRHTLAQQGLAQRQHQMGMENELRQKQLAQNFQLTTAREAVASQYKNQTLELAKQRLADTHEKYLKHLSDQRMYNIGLQGGMSPKDLAVQFPDAFSTGQWGDILRPSKPDKSGEPSVFDKKQLDSLYDIYNDLSKKSAAATDDAVKADLKNQANATMVKIQSLASKFQKPEAGAAPSPAPPASDGGQAPAEPAEAGAGQQAAPAADSGTPKVGEIFNGYSFKGGDPADQANWEEVTK